jgi:hypothetical protein
VETTEEQPVPLTIAVPLTEDKDGSETAVLLIRGVPAGAGFTNATGDAVGTDLGGGTWQFDPTNSDGLTFVPPALFTGVINLTVAQKITDTASFLPLPETEQQVAEKPVPFTVTVTGTPVSVGFEDTFVSENSPTETVSGFLFAGGGHPNETFTFAFVSTDGYDFTVDPDGAVRVGTQNPDYEAVPQFTLTVRATGDRGSVVTQSVVVNIRDEDDPATIVGPGPQTIFEDTPGAITGLQVADPDFGYAYVDLTLSVANGTLSADPVSAMEFGVFVGTDETGAVTLSGSLDDVNAFLASPGAVMYQPPPDFSGVETLTVALVEYTGEGSSSALVSSFGPSQLGGESPYSEYPYYYEPFTLTVERPFTVAPVADPPAVEFADAQGDEDTLIPLSLFAATTDVDGSETVTVTLRGVPAGASFEANGVPVGTDLGGGAWQFTPAQLSGLAFRPPLDASGVFPLTVEFTVVDTAPGTQLTNTLTQRGTLTITVNPVVDVPVVSVSDAVIDEGTTANLPVSAAAGDTDGSETVTILVLGIPPDFTVTGGTFDPDLGGWVFTPAGFTNLQLFAPQDANGIPVELTVRVTAFEVSDGPSVTVEKTFQVTVRNVAPVLDGLAVSGTASPDAPVTLALGQLIDPGAEPGWTVTIDWGDGTVDTIPVAATGPQGSVTHQYTTAGSFTITVTVADDDDTTQSTLSVGPPAPAPLPTPPPDPGTPPPGVPPAAPAPVFFPAQPLAGLTVPVFTETVPQDVETDGRDDDTTTTRDSRTRDSDQDASTLALISLDDRLPGYDVPSTARANLPAVGAFSIVTPAALGTTNVAPSSNPIAILWLDPTTPQAGFSESYGESLELIDRLCREQIPVSVPVTAATPPAPAPAPPPPAVATVAGTADPGTPQSEPGPGSSWWWPVLGVLGVTSLTGAATYLSRRSRLGRLLDVVRRKLALR